MNSLQPAYCPVCREHIIKTIYRRLQARIMLAAQPVSRSTVRIRQGEAQTFSVSALQPSQGLSWEWSIDGELLSTEETLTVDGCAGLQGELQLVLRDDTEWVRYDPQAYLVDRITWNLKTDQCDAQACGCQAMPHPAMALAMLLPLGWRRKQHRGSPPQKG
jgi:hypothetical protein